MSPAPIGSRDGKPPTSPYSANGRTSYFEDEAAVTAFAVVSKGNTRETEEDVGETFLEYAIPTPRIKTVPERGQWGKKLDFVFGCISYAIGLGNVWRFPYLCYDNGGGAFLVPYFICLILCAVPMFTLEVAMGQYMSLGGISIWNMVPMFKGIGFASMAIAGLCNVYYIIIVAWILFYLFSSFTSELPWKNCDPDWSSSLCLSWEFDKKAHALNASHILLNESISPITEFWERKVLGITDGLHNLGSLQLQLSLYLLLAWLVVYLVIWQGLHQSGKIIWVTALFPYVIMSILFVRGVTLEGASLGLLYYITPIWGKLLEPKVWIAAGTQVFYTYGIGYGSVIILGSYNQFHHNFLRDSMILCCVNPFTSLFAGTVIFSVLGHMAHVQEKHVEDVVKSGPGLAFLTYPEVVLQLPGSPFWAVVFFMMLFVLGIDSQFCVVDGFITGLADEWPRALRSRKKLFTLVACIAMFLLGLPMVTQGGMYIFQLMDYYSASGITLLFTVMFQTIAVAWIYGADRMAENIKEMVGRRPCRFYTFCWKVTVPLITMGILVFSMVQYKPMTYANTYIYPWWGQMMGWGMALVSMLWIPGYMIYFLAITPGSFKERLMTGITPRLTPKQRKTSPVDDSLLEAASTQPYATKLTHLKTSIL